MGNRTKPFKSNKLILRIKNANEIGIYKSVLWSLGRPSNIQFWWSESQKTLLVGAAKENTDTSFPIPDYIYSYQNGLKFSGRKLLKTLCLLSELNSSVVYKIKGEFIPEIDMVAFKINNALTEVCVNG